MSEILSDILKSHGPILSSDLAEILVANYGLTREAARQRVSRGGPGIKKLGYLTFPRNARFVYLEQQFGAPEYWKNLIKALQDTNSIYGSALASIRLREDLIPEKHFWIACGAPFSNLKKHISARSVLDRLIAAGLVQIVEVESVGRCVGLVQFTDYYERRGKDLKARLIAERFLLTSVKTWIQNLGLGSYHQVATRNEKSDDEPPTVSAFAWDLSAPSYLHPLLQFDNTNRLKQGFIVVDVFLGSPVTAEGLRPFIKKCEAVRAQRNSAKCIQMMVADEYSKEAYDLAKRHGFIPATTRTLFGKDVAEGLMELINIFRHISWADIDAQKVDSIFEKLGKLPGAVAQLRGDLFEFIAADYMRKTSAHQSVKMKQIYKSRLGEKSEVDVVVVTNSRTVIFIECKGYAPYNEIPDDLVDRWLTKTIPQVREYALEHPDWRNYSFEFEFWTTGKLSEVAIENINKRQLDVNPNKYKLLHRDASELYKMFRNCNDKGLFDIFNVHFLNHPLKQTINSEYSLTVQVPPSVRVQAALPSSESSNPEDGISLVY
jgi:hypothetical protein